MRSVGGSVSATQCSVVYNEVLGESNGKPGQTFQLLQSPVLPRTAEEYILINPVAGLPQVSVQTEVSLEPEYDNPLAKQQVLAHLQTLLYRFLNPITGGASGSGWEFGRPVYPSDIVTLLQKVPGVRYLGTIQLFELRQQGEQGNWRRTLPREPIIAPGIKGLICSWRDSRLRSGHLVSII